MSYHYSKVETPGTQVDACFEINKEADTGDRTDLIIPDCTPGIMFVEKGSFIRRDLRDDQILSEGNWYLFGQKSRSVEYHFNRDHLKAFGAKLDPAALFSLLGFSADQLTDRVLTLSDVTLFSGRDLAIFQEKNLSQADRMDAMVRFLARPTPLPEGYHLVSLLLAEIHRSRGEMPVSRLLTKFDLGYKRVERLFKLYVGLTPKLYARIIRFSYCVRHGLYRHLGMLTDIAYQNGYFDQTHFIKETKCFTGRIPSEIFYDQGQVPVERGHVGYLLERGY